MAFVACRTGAFAGAPGVAAGGDVEATAIVDEAFVDVFAAVDADAVAGVALIASALVGTVRVRAGGLCCWEGDEERIRFFLNFFSVVVVMVRVVVG